MLTIEKRKKILGLLDRYGDMVYYAHSDSYIDSEFEEYARIVQEQEKYRFLYYLEKIFLSDFVSESIN